MQGSSYAPLQFLRSPWNRDVYTAIDNQVDGRTTLVLYLGSASTLPDELQKYNVGCILIHKDEKQIYLNTGNDTTPTWESFGPGTNTLPTPFLPGQYLSNDGVDTFWTLIDLATGVTGLLDSDHIDLADLANNSDFIDYLIANSYFTDELANDPNFISELLANATFISDLITTLLADTDFINGIDSIVTDVINNSVTPIGTGVKVDSLDTTSGYLDDKISITSSDGSVTVTKTINNPSGNEDIVYDISTTGNTSILVVNQVDDFLSGVLASNIAGNTNARNIGLLNWNGKTTASTNTSDIVYVSGETNHPGILKLSTQGAIYLGDPDNSVYPISQFAQSGNEYNFIVRVTSGSPSTQAAIIKLGVTTVTISGAMENNEIQVLFDTQNSDIIFKTRDSSVTESTTINSSFTSSFYNIKIVCNGTSVECYLDNVLVATHSTHIPSTTVSGSATLYLDSNTSFEIDLAALKYQAAR